MVSLGSRAGTERVAHSSTVFPRQPRGRPVGGGSMLVLPIWVVNQAVMSHDSLSTIIQ